MGPAFVLGQRSMSSNQSAAKARLRRALIEAGIWVDAMT